jgi:hypothetical protein
LDPVGGLAGWDPLQIWIKADFPPSCGRHAPGAIRTELDLSPISLALNSNLSHHLYKTIELSAEQSRQMGRGKCLRWQPPQAK